MKVLASEVVYEASYVLRCAPARIFTGWDWHWRCSLFFFRGGRNTIRKVRLFSQPDFCQANNYIFPGQDSGPIRNGLIRSVFMEA